MTLECSRGAQAEPSRLVTAFCMPKFHIAWVLHCFPQLQYEVSKLIRRPSVIEGPLVCGRTTSRSMRAYEPGDSHQCSRTLRTLILGVEYSTVARADLAVSSDHDSMMAKEASCSCMWPNTALSTQHSTERAGFGPNQGLCRVNTKGTNALT